MCVACGRKYRPQAQQQQQTPAQPKLRSPRAGAVPISAPKPTLKYPRWRLKPLVVKKEE